MNLFVSACEVSNCSASLRCIWINRTWHYSEAVPDASLTSRNVCRTQEDGFAVAATHLIRISPATAWLASNHSYTPQRRSVDEKSTILDSTASTSTIGCVQELARPGHTFTLFLKSPPWPLTAGARDPPHSLSMSAQGNDNGVWGGVNITEAALEIQSAISTPTCSTTEPCTDFVDLEVSAWRWSSGFLGLPTWLTSEDTWVFGGGRRCFMLVYSRLPAPGRLSVHIPKLCRSRSSSRLGVWGMYGNPHGQFYQLSTN